MRIYFLSNLLLWLILMNKDNSWVNGKSVQAVHYFKKVNMKVILALKCPCNVSSERALTFFRLATIQSWWCSFFVHGWPRNLSITNFSRPENQKSIISSLPKIVASDSKVPGSETGVQPLEDSCGKSALAKSSNQSMNK